MDDADGGRGADADSVSAAHARRRRLWSHVEWLGRHGVNQPTLTGLRLCIIGDDIWAELCSDGQRPPDDRSRAPDAVPNEHTQADGRSRPSSDRRDDMPGTGERAADAATGVNVPNGPTGPEPYGDDAGVPDGTESVVRVGWRTCGVCGNHSYTEGQGWFCWRCGTLYPYDRLAARPAPEVSK